MIEFLKVFWGQGIRMIRFLADGNITMRFQLNLNSRHPNHLIKEIIVRKVQRTWIFRLKNSFHTTP